MPHRLTDVLDGVVKTVNSVKARPLNARLFSELTKIWEPVHCLSNGPVKS